MGVLLELDVTDADPALADCPALGAHRVSPSVMVNSLQ